MVRREMVEEEHVDDETGGGSGPSENVSGATKPKPTGVGRKRWGTAVLALVGLAIAAAGAGLYLHSNKASPSGATWTPLLVVHQLEASGRAASARRTQEACRGSITCACRQVVARSALDADLHVQALAALRSDPDCATRTESRGMEAEAIVRAGRVEEGLAKAEKLLKTTPADPFATYAVAQASYEKGDPERAMQQAGAAVAKGRGAPALLLLGLIQFHKPDYERAKVAFQHMLQLDPDDTAALYNLALTAQIQNRYRDAREGYLHVLRVAPKNADARYNLGVLTHSVGATAEAKHHLEELEKIAPPDDQRVKKLKKLLTQPPHAQAGTTAPRPSGAPPRLEPAAGGAPIPPAVPH